MIAVSACLLGGVSGASAETVALPNGATPYASLNATACPAAGDCVAVGVYEDTAAHNHGVTDTESNGAWSTAQPNLSGLSPTSELESDLTEVACTSTGNCVAAGTYLSTSGYAVLIDTETGGSWTASTVALPGSGSSQPAITGLSCPTAGDCVAIGTFLTGSSLHEGLLLVQSGGVWSAQTAPLPGLVFPIGYDPDTSLDGASCTAAGSCVVVGSYTDTGGNKQALIETQSGASWHGSEVSLPSDASDNTEAELESVSCSSAGNCTAVGRYNVFAFILDTYAPLLLTESGGSWGTATAGTLPSDANFSAMQSQLDLYLRSVSCVSPGNCTAVGSYDSSVPVDQTPLAFTEADGHWATGVELTLPSPGLVTSSNHYQDAQLDSVDCLTAGECVAGGTYDGAGGVPQALVATMSSGSWSTAGTPEGSGANSGVTSQDGSVACSASGYCVASGYASATTALDTSVPFLLQPPDAVPSPSASLSGTQASVSWSAPSDDGGLPVTGYEVTANDLTDSARGGQTVLTGGTSATVTGLTPGDTYTFTVTPQSLLGTGLSATSAGVTAPASVTAPPNVTAPPSPTRAKPSLAQIRASLAGLASPAAKGGLKRMLKHGFTLNYAALEAGSVTIDWYRYTGRGKHRHKHLIASGHGSALSIQTISVKVKLNALGRRLAKAGHAVHVTETVRFKAAGTTTSSTHRFTLK